MKPFFFFNHELDKRTYVGKIEFEAECGKFVKVSGYYKDDKYTERPWNLCVPLRIVEKWDKHYNDITFDSIEELKNHMER